MPTDPAGPVADELASAHYARRQIIARRASERARDMWSEVDPNAIGTTWSQLLPTLARDVATTQLGVALLAEPYVTDIVGTATAAGAVQARTFAAVASDGRPLVSLLQSPAIRTFTSIAQGMAIARAMDIGSRQLGMIVGTQIQDAGRVADGVAIAARDGIGYVRELRTPSCSRCVVLAGQFYRWNAGFLRHPRCDCSHRPAARSDDVPTFDERRYFDSLSTKDQDRTFTVAGAKAIRDGADIGQVVNARRGMVPAGTIEGTTKRGLAGQRIADGGDAFVKGPGRYTRTTVRLMPEQIYAMSTSRTDAVRRLRAAGFIV